MLVDDGLQLVQQLLRAADAEGRDQQRAAVGKGMLAHRAQTLAPGASALVVAVAVGAFQHQHVCQEGRLRRGQQRRVRGAQVTGEDDALRPGPRAPHGAAGRRLCTCLGRRGGGPLGGDSQTGRVGDEVELHIRRPENMPCGLQLHLQPAAPDARSAQGQPASVGQGHDLPLQLRHDAFDQRPIAREADLQRVAHHHRQQLGRGLAAHHRALEARSQQVRQTPHMIDVHVCDHQRDHRPDIEADLQPPEPSRPVGRGLRALEQPAIHQHRGAVGQGQLVTGAGDAVDGAVVDDGPGHDHLLFRR